MKKRTSKQNEREEKGKQKPRWRLKQHGGEKEDRKDRESKTCIEKEMKKRLFWGAVGCETGPFTLN